MKTKTWAVLLALALGLSVFTQMRSVKAESKDTLSGVVVLDGREIYDSKGYPVAFVVETSSSSPGSPIFRSGDDLSSALALLRANGFQITVHAWGWLTYTAIR